MKRLLYISDKVGVHIAKPSPLLVIVFWGLLTSIPFHTFALDSLNFRLLDYAKQQFPAEDKTLQGIADSLRTATSSEKERAEIAFYWIAEHMDYDFEAEKVDWESLDYDAIMRSQRGNFETFSQLYQEMCTMLDLECYLVPGYTKLYMRNDIADYYFTGEEEELPDRPYHTWNAVKIDGAYHFVDISMGIGSLGGDEERPEFIKKYDLELILENDGVFVRTHLPADPRWQLRTHPILIKTYFRRLTYEQMLTVAEAGTPFNYEAQLKEYERASKAERRLLRLKSSFRFHRTDHTTRQLADALYNMGYQRSLEEYSTDGMIAARKFYQQAVDAYKLLEDQTTEVKKLKDQARQGITYVNYRLEKKQ